MLCGSTCRDSALVRSMFRYTWGLRVLKVAARPRRPGLAFPFWTSSAGLRESSLRARLRPLSPPHREPAGLAEAADGRRNHHEGQRFLDPGEVAVETGDDPILGQPLAALAPVLVHDERRGEVRDGGKIEDRDPADGHPS